VLGPIGGDPERHDQKLAAQLQAIQQQRHQVRLIPAPIASAAAWPSYSPKFPLTAFLPALGAELAGSGSRRRAGWRAATLLEHADAAGQVRNGVGRTSTGRSPQSHMRSAFLASFGGAMINL
jgi:hypothetical protein